MAKLDLNKEITLGKGSHGKRPTKTSINLVIKPEKKIKLPYLLAAVLMVLLIIGFGVVKPIFSLTAANAKVASLQTQIEEANKELESYGDVEEEYAHYTTAGMTKEELTRNDRVKVMKLVEDAVVNSGAVKSWNITENIMTLQVHGSSLAELNQIASALEKESIVERCVINNANRGGNKDSNGVDVSFIVYLSQQENQEMDVEMTEEETGEEEQQ